MKWFLNFAKNSQKKSSSYKAHVAPLDPMLQVCGKIAQECRTVGGSRVKTTVLILRQVLQFVQRTRGAYISLAAEYLDFPEH